MHKNDNNVNIGYERPGLYSHWGNIFDQIFCFSRCKACDANTGIIANFVSLRKASTDNITSPKSTSHM